MTYHAGSIIVNACIQEQNRLLRQRNFEMESQSTQFSALVVSLQVWGAYVTQSGGISVLFKHPYLTRFL